MQLAQQFELDLVEVAPNVTPPVCRIMDFGKYMYEESKKHSHVKTTASKIKEIEFSVRIEQNDFITKLRHAEEFLDHGNKVKLRLKFRGREMARTEMGFEIVNRAINELVGMGHPDGTPKLTGRNIYAMLTPLPVNKRKAKIPPQGGGRAAGCHAGAVASRHAGAFAGRHPAPLPDASLAGVIPQIHGAGLSARGLLVVFSGLLLAGGCRRRLRRKNRSAAAHAPADRPVPRPGARLPSLRSPRPRAAPASRLWPFKRLYNVDYVDVRAIGERYGLKASWVVSGRDHAAGRCAAAACA